MFAAATHAPIEGFRCGQAATDQVFLRWHGALAVELRGRDAVQRGTAAAVGALRIAASTHHAARRRTSTETTRRV